MKKTYGASVLSNTYDIIAQSFRPNVRYLIKKMSKIKFTGKE